MIEEIERISDPVGVAWALRQAYPWVDRIFFRGYVDGDRIEYQCYVTQQKTPSGYDVVACQQETHGVGIMQIDLWVGTIGNDLHFFLLKDR